ncbi:ATP-binding protein [Flavobacterium johnsoniae]|uniref:ATP-binding protein n=1 Tax=Flavobacterium johnsoniae TaxID=986 RepID=UPI003D96F48B
MTSNIIFVGGIHGVGKSTICQEICNDLELGYLSASDLINWQKLNSDFQNKTVHNIIQTQDRLILALENNIKKDLYYVLDGHYCLLNKENTIVNIPLQTFKLINPCSLNVILGNSIEIKDRLEKRDGRIYSLDLLEKLQENELNYAKYLSKNLGVSLNIGTQNDYSELIRWFNNFIREQK